MATKNGVIITLKAFFPIGGSVDEQLAALSKIKKAHEEGAYVALLLDAIIEKVAVSEPTRKRFADDDGQADIEDAVASAPQADDPDTSSEPPSEGEDEPPAFVRDESRRRKSAA